MQRQEEGVLPNIKPTLFQLYFDPSLAGIPYSSPEEELRDWSYLVDMHLHCLLWMREQKKLAGSEGPDHLRGMAVTSEEAQSYVMSSFRFNREMGLRSDLQDCLRQGWSFVQERGAAGDGAAQEILRRFAASPFEKICLYLAVSARLDRKYERLFSYLYSDMDHASPTVGLAWSMYTLWEPQAEWGECLGMLCRPEWGLLYENGAGTGLSQSYTLRENVLHTLLGRQESGAQAARVCEPVASGELPAPCSLHYGEPLRESVRLAVHRARMSRRPLVIQLWGDEGSGRMYTLLCCAAVEGWALLRVHCGEWQEMDQAQLDSLLAAIVSDAAVSGFMPVLCDLDALGKRRATRIVEYLSRAGVGILFCCSVEPDALGALGGCTLLRYGMPSISPSERLELWQAQAAGRHLAPGMDLTYLSSKYRLNPGQIRDAFESADLCAGEELREEDLTHAIISAGQGELSRECVRITPVYTFDDLILPDAAKKQVRAILDRVHNSYRVNVEWGFGARYAYGRGISVLMYGRPGTGKTMCAQVLANELQLELYKVDLSQLISKYIGETEKNISDIFRNAQKSNAILFFDEADSLFSKRTADMNGSNDKYANMETAHLLQKMEEFDGITILATNLAGTFDKAFYRRLQYIINIPLPDAPTRLEIWRRSFPERCPLDEGVDLEVLARQHEISPSSIKTAALGAAFRAVAAGAPKVGMRHILASLRDELAKEGKTMSPQEMLGFDLTD